MYIEVRYGIGSGPLEVVTITGPKNISVPILTHLLTRLVDSKYHFSVEITEEVKTE